MAAISKAFSVGDTVYVRYPYAGTAVGWLPASRVVSVIDFTAAADVCTVKFTNGNDVQDSTATPRVYTTQALCATAIVTDIIANATAACVLDPTLSGASTAGQPTTSLIRND